MSALSRRVLLAALAAAHAQSTPPRAHAQSTPLPTLRVLVTAVLWRSLEPMVEEFARIHPNVVSGITFQEANAAFIGTPAFAGPVLAAQPGFDVVITGLTGGSLGTLRDLWQPLPSDILAGFRARLSPRNQAVQDQAGNLGALLWATTGGPFLLHRPTAGAPPRDPSELLAYARQNPGRFLYPNPSQSPHGRHFIAALPHLLGDPDPMDPIQGWHRTWPWLFELGRHVAYYPASSDAAFDEMAEGGCDMMPASLSGWLRRLGSGGLPADTRITPFDDGPIIPAPVFFVVPRGVAPDKHAAIEAFAHFLWQPDVQMRGFGRGILPGDPGANPAALPELARLLPAGLADNVTARPLAPVLSPKAFFGMLERWDASIGAFLGQPG